VNTSEDDLLPPIAHPRRRRTDSPERLIRTTHPSWINEMLVAHTGAWRAVVHATPFEETIAGPFPRAGWRQILLDFFSLVEAFPKYLGLCLAKTTYGQRPRDSVVRAWFIDNIQVESLHVKWYLDWAAAYSISPEELFAHRAIPEVAALAEWLWSISYRGTLAESVAAVNFAIEGTTGEWCQRALPAFQAELGLGSRSTTWLRAHGRYDDEHHHEALEIMKIYAESPRERQLCASAVLRSLELFASALEASFRAGGLRVSAK
jgi:pyrroloquinoline quinone (PQQ) biosynthesis protein C